MNIVEAFVYGIPRVTSDDGLFMTVGTGKPGVVNISDLTSHRPIIELVHPSQIRLSFSENEQTYRRADFISEFLSGLARMDVITEPVELYGDKVNLIKRLPLKHGPAKKDGGLTFAQMKGCFYAGAKQRH